MRKKNNEKFSRYGSLKHYMYLSMITWKNKRTLQRRKVVGSICRIMNGNISAWYVCKEIRNVYNYNAAET